LNEELHITDLSQERLILLLEWILYRGFLLLASSLIALVLLAVKKEGNNSFFDNLGVHVLLVRLLHQCLLQSHFSWEDYRRRMLKH
jgi:hypothetical protein